MNDEERSSVRGGTLSFYIKPGGLQWLNQIEFFVQEDRANH